MNINFARTYFGVETAGVGVIRSGSGEEAVISLGKSSVFTATYEAFEQSVAPSSAVLKVQLSCENNGPWVDVPSGCLLTGGVSTFGPSAAVAGPIDVRGFGYARVVVSTAESGKKANIGVIAKGGLE